MAGAVMIMNSTTYSNPPPPPPEPPVAPTLISPTNGSKVSNTSVTFQWNPSADATNYHIKVSIDPNVETPLFHSDWTAGATSKNYTDFPNDGTVYYWKVRAYGTAGWGSWSTIWHFDNGDVPEAPAAPILVSPANGSNVTNTSITFQWNPSSSATNYQIRVSIDPNVETPLFHDNTTGGATSKNYTDFPNDGTVYYWKVRAYNAVGWGNWSTVWYFSNGDDDTPVIESGHVGYYDFTPGQTRFWKFVSYVPEGCQYPIQIGNTPQSTEPHTTRLVIKRGSKPTIEDYEWLVTLGSSTYDCGDGQYYPAKPPGSEDFFWRFNTGSGGEFIEIFEPMGSYTFYIMFYNSGEESVNNQRLTTHYNE